MQVGETDQGPVSSASGEQSEIGRLILSDRDDFPLEQSHDETLKHAFEKVSTIDGPAWTSTFLSVFCDHKRQVVSSDPRHSDKRRYDPIISYTLRELYELLGIKSIRTSVFHPQTDGLVERFNRTLKSMIRKFVQEDAKNWDKWLEPLLFAVREVPQASTGFSPFELLFGRQPRGVLDVLRETWEDGPSQAKNEIQYVLDLRTK